jgi:DNA-binding MarR family transcriptional regulator
MTRPAFAAIPMRALGDQRLTATHLRALAAIAYRDRFSRNGQGCWASPQDLAALAGCNTNNLVSATSDLTRWGYVSREPRPDDKRKRVYRVLYTDQDHAWVNLVRAQANKSSEIVRPDAGDRSPIFGTFANKNNDMTPEHNHRKDIAQSAMERNSAEADTHINVRAKHVEFDDWTQEREASTKAARSRGKQTRTDAEFLLDTERWLKAEPDRPYGDADMRTIVRMSDRCIAIYDARDLDDPLAQWANRLASELSWIIRHHGSALV